MAVNTATTARAFANPVKDAAVAFRVLLEAMARPGSVGTPPLPEEPPEGLSPAASAALLTLADYSTPLWLSPGLEGAAVTGYLKFHCGAPITGAAGEADIAVVERGATSMDFDAFKRGLPDYPDRAATLLIEVVSLEEGEALALSGPGIERTCGLRVLGAPEGLWEALRRNRADFPLGLDVLLCAENSLVALPRSTRIEVQSCT